MRAEPDERIGLWARVRLGGERVMDVAGASGYRDASGVTQLVKRLEAAAQQNERLRKKLADLKTEMSNVKS